VNRLSVAVPYALNEERHEPTASVATACQLKVSRSNTNHSTPYAQTTKTATGFATSNPRWVTRLRSVVDGEAVDSPCLHLSRGSLPIAVEGVLGKSRTQRAHWVSFHQTPTSPLS
jgi:hypothetical protein